MGGFLSRLLQRSIFIYDLAIFHLYTRSPISVLETAEQCRVLWACPDVISPFLFFLSIFWECRLVASVCLTGDFQVPFSFLPKHSQTPLCPVHSKPLRLIISKLLDKKIIVQLLLSKAQFLGCITLSR